MSPLSFENDFFKLYKAFLIADSRKALIYGRERAIIKDFFIWYIKHKIIKQKKEEITDILMSYCDEFLECNFDKVWDENDKKLKNESIKILSYSTECYVCWRENLNIEDIMCIAKHNIKDRINYYFQVNDKDIESILKPIQNKKNNIVLPRQLLMEFHNAMSHMLQIYEGKKYDNVSRACNHFKRGALDLYKIIIKDFFILYPPNCPHNTQKIQNKLFEIRAKEYELIGYDKARTSNIKFKNNSNVGIKQKTLFEEYYNLTKNIIDFYLNHRIDNSIKN